MNEMATINGILISLIKCGFTDEKEARDIMRVYLDLYPEVRASLLKQLQSERRYMEPKAGFTTISYMSSFGLI